MKKFLFFLVVFSFIIITNSTIISCTNMVLNPYTLNGQTFNVKINTFNDFSVQNSKQNQWGKNSIGSLYSTLWTINNEAAKKEYPIQNQEIASYLTNGESLSSQPDDGSNIVLNGNSENNLNSQDWHKDILNITDVVIFKMTCIIYDLKGFKNLEVRAVITINIIY